MPLACLPPDRVEENGLRREQGRSCRARRDCVNPRCMRRIKPNEECSPNCTKCGTLWHDRLESGKAKVLSFDYFVRPSWNYQQMLALSEFGDAVADF